ncbi:hypothetical protein DM482_03310 [Avibacterium paragallinarum]|uniref:Uncharacterized protein n=2 Tax=Avibacterium paragallinarum TaxID=728 RepID=A0AAE5WIW0_AVIPA|nr:hypothetical protein DM482_03310 [Avibacterium paragallinarum]PXZ41637.1 hypothetical protein DM481_04675 [Avibacterium paragallinarum]
MGNQTVMRSPYSGIHQIHQMPIFVEGALTYGKFKHLVAQQHYQQNFLATSIESGYRYQKIIGLSCHLFN